VTFKTDLEYGKDAEHLILKRIQVKYPLAFMIEGKHKAYDIFVPEINQGIEVKSDRQAEDTRNIFIEIECNFMKSGILTTTAEWYVYQTTKRVFMIRTNDLKVYLIEHAPKLKMFNNTPKGEVSSVRGYLISYYDFSCIAETLYEIED
jgi:hypothetical protein